MRYMVWVPLLMNLAVVCGAPALARRIPYRVRPGVLTGTAAVAAVGWLWSLALLATSLAERLPSLGHRLDLPVPGPGRTAELPPAAVGACASAVVAIAVVTLVVATVRLARELARAERLVRRLPAGRVHVVAGELPDACAIGGVTGSRIMITTGLVDCLDAAERAAVLAHEQAHLAGRHHWLRLVVACCAATDPLLRRLPQLVEAACERWADERAAQPAGQRTVLARALGKAALATLRASGTAPRANASATGSATKPDSMPDSMPDRELAPGFGAGPTACGFDRGAVPERMAALLAGPPRATGSPAWLLMSTVVTALVLGSCVHASTDFLTLLRWY